MTNDASLEAAGDVAGGPASAAPIARPSIFDLRQVAPLSPGEQQAKEDAMARTLAFGAQPVRDGRGWALELDFIAANGEAVEPWRHDPRHKRLYRRSQALAKAAGQLIGQPGDRVELAKRLAVLHHREGSDIEGAVRRGLFDAIWRYDHVYDSFTVPRRYGTHFMKTGRVAAVAEEQRRRWQAEGLAPADAFWVRNRRNTGLVLVSPNPDPDAVSGEMLMGSGGDDVVSGDAASDESVAPLAPSVETPEAAPEAIRDTEPAAAEAPVTPADRSEPEDQEDFALDPRTELDLLRQLGVDVDAPSLPGSRLHALKQATTKVIEPGTNDGVLDAVVEGFEREWKRLQRQGIRRYIPPGLRETYDALPRGAELVELVKSVAPGSGEAQSLLDYNAAANRFVERLGAGDEQGATEAAADAVSGLAGAIPLIGGSARGTKALGKTVERGAAAKKAKRVPSRRPLQVVLEKTPGRNEQGRLRQIRDLAKRTLPDGFLDQTAAQAIAKTRFPPRDPRENVRRGLAAVDLVVEQALRGEPGVLTEAMFRKDVGPITFLFGKPGDPIKDYRRGSGISHIIAKHGAKVVDDVVETIAKGLRIQQPGAADASRMLIHHRGHIAVLSLYRSGARETWLLTGYKTGVSDINFDLSQLLGPIYFKQN